MFSGFSFFQPGDVCGLFPFMGAVMHRLGKDWVAGWREREEM